MDTTIKQFIETTGSEITLNCENTDLFEIFLKNNITIYLTNIINSKSITIQFQQDSTGSRTVAFSNQFTFPDVSTVSSTAKGFTVMKFDAYEGRCVCTFNSNASAGGTETFDTANITTLNATTVDINGGTVDGTTIGATTPSTGAFTALKSTVLANDIIYVDGGRVDTYTADGTLLLPYKTILAAVTVINADASAHQTANTFTQANYIVNVAPGTYADDFEITNVKNLRFNMHGAYVTGNITYTTTMVGGSADNYYARLEFVGCTGVRAEKGPAARLSGTFTATRNNDSLTYVSFSGVHIAGNVAFTTNGTWVVHLHNCRVAGYLEGLTLAANSTVLLETTGWNEFGGKIAASADDGVTDVCLYNVDNTEFYGLINISNALGSRITNSRFGAAVTITGGNISIDAKSYKSLVGQTETLTGSTLIPLDNAYPTATGIYTSKTIKKTIGGVGVAGCDFNFATAENTSEQIINLGAIVPALARVTDIFIHTNAVFTGATTLVADVGSTSGGAEYITSATVYATDAILAIAVGGAFVTLPSVTAGNVYVNATPGANWSLVTAGKLTVYVTYNDVANI